MPALPGGVWLAHDRAALVEEEAPKAQRGLGL
jgi:hypothetical protein